jgi:hypothetical protein
MKTTKDILKGTKTNYKVKNWGVYNKALKQRGSLILWIPDDIESWWYGTGKKTYSDRAIETILTIGSLNRYPLRMLSGYIESLFKLMNIDLQVPDYTTLSRRMKKLPVELKKRKKETTDIIFDSTGIKVFGEGEWKVRKHGWNYRRTWKKLHIGIDSEGEIRTQVMTSSTTHDSVPFNTLLKQEGIPITDFYGDGAYDSYDIYTTLQASGITPHIPPQKNAKIKVHGNTKGVLYTRDESIRSIRKKGRKKWKQDSGYHTRSLVETTMFRFKSTFGGSLSFRVESSQQNELTMKCTILNTFRELGMPESCKVS